ncbi:MAG: hypothetical protein HC903_12060 [Methylacidiphilales bacterium]|nr:hypothetical protein [Candidatus Methylacidiphilales bacterium]NJR18286.1 hypothetical protein [Calothrix sp. CSU_2_0]
MFILIYSRNLIIEVVSTNWRDDYHRKVGEYLGLCPSR